MGIAVVLSASGAPGVTTAAMALGLTSPRHTLVLEADTSRTSDILAGYFRGALRAGEQGLDGLAALVATRDLTPITIQSQEVRANDTTTVIPGFQRLETAAAATALWPDIASALLDVGRNGRDVLVDLGRWSVDDSRTALLRAADAVLILTRTQLPAILATRTLLAALASNPALADGADRVRLVLRDGGPQGYDEAAIRSALAPILPVSVLGHISDDPRGAAVFSVGAADGKTMRRASYTRSIETLGTDLRRHFDARAEQIEQLAARQTYEGGAL